MLKLPKVDKGTKNLPKVAKVIKKIVIGVAISLGITIASAPANALPTKEIHSAEKAAVGASYQTRDSENYNTLMLKPYADKVIQTAGHYSHTSHSSHYSHSSHSSHHSHYSSRY